MPAGVARLRFWRPFPRSVVDLICGEGAVAELPLQAYEALRVILPTSRFTIVDGRGQATVLRPGLVHFAAPLEPHATRSIDGAPCAMRVLLVAPVALATVGSASRGPAAAAAPQLRSGIVDDADLYAWLCTLVDDVRGPLVALDSASRIRDCLLQLYTRTAAPWPARPLPSGRQLVAVARIRDHLREHVTETVSLEELAHVAGLSKFYLLRAFSRLYGVTPHAYQMLLRLAYAWRLIADGASLTRATYDAGFADQSHLTRRFTDLFGVTPGRHARELAVPPGSISKNARDVGWPAAPPSAA